LKRRLFIGIVALGFCLVAGVLAFRRSGEGPLYQGKTIEGWAAQLLAPGADVREQATSVFRGLGSNAVPGLIKLLESHDPIWRKQLWGWALRLPPRYRPGLLRHSRVPREAEIHREAAMALTIIGPNAKAAVPALGRALLSKERENCWCFADALGAMGPEALAALTHALANSDPDIRAAAIFGLGKLGPAAEPAVSPLLQCLKDENANVRDRAVQALTGIGPPAVPELIQAIEHEKGQVRQGAAKALMNAFVQRRLIEPALLGMLQDEEPASRQQAIATLAAIHAREEPVILAIAACLKDPVPEVRVAAAKGLAEMSRKAQPAVPALIEALKDATERSEDLGPNRPTRESGAARLGSLVGRPGRLGVRRSQRGAAENARRAGEASPSVMSPLGAANITSVPHVPLLNYQIAFPDACHPKNSSRARKSECLRLTSNRAF
jgi:HEAT repeat protein